MKIYNRIKDLREDIDKNQTEIAELIQVSEAQYRRYEQGKNIITLDRAEMLAEYYNVSLDYIAGRTNDKGGLHCNYIEKEKRELLSNWDLLSDHEKNSIKITIDAFLRSKKQKNVQKFG